MNILHSIITHKKKEVARRKKKQPLAYFISTLAPSDRDFKKTLAGGRNDVRPRLIAELKKASPSEGLLRANLEEKIETIAGIYAKHAAAISVVTDEKFFQGKREWLTRAREAAHLPILCKDFIVDEYQIYEARKYGADAILLIAAALNKTKLKKFIKTSADLGINSLVEVHAKSELETAISAGAKIIGINNRNLETFEVLLETTFALAPLVPKQCVIVSESGFATREDIQKMRGLADAVLVGTWLMRAKDINKTMQSLT